MLVKDCSVENYRECSALTGDGIPEAMEAAARLSLMPKKRRKNGACSVL